MTPLARQLKKRYSYFEYLQWDEGRWEIIDGVLYDMTPAPSRQHQKISGDLFVKIHNQLSNSSCEVYSAPFDVRLPGENTHSDDKIFTVVQPDITVICDKDKLDDRGCVGAPDLLVEILSPATAAYDLKIKRDLYEKHGVKEYWIVHPVDKIFMIYTLSEDGCYQKAAIFSGKDIIESSAVDGLRINLEDIFGKVENKKSLPKVDGKRQIG